MSRARTPFSDKHRQQKGRRASLPVASRNHHLNPESTMPDSTQNKAESHHTAEDLKALLHEAEQALSATAGEAGDKFDELRDRLRAALDSGRYSFDRLRHEATLRAKQADQLVRDNPYYAIGIAAGVGAIVGILASRSCNSSR
jgi:ElaB/YqjD/DUF883 family membrane-anchored ribosome-binding protein